MKMLGHCFICKKEFFSARGNKKYCSLACYNKDPEVLLRLKEANKERAKEHQIEVSCKYCHRVWMEKKSRKSRFCNNICYRKFMAERFDKWIASPETIALPQNYDEFLTQNELPCLVAGCTWKGKQLSTHMNLTHGVPEEQFKKMAGFNLKSAIMTPDLVARQSEAAKKWSVLNNAEIREKSALVRLAQQSHNRNRNYKSLEGREHYSKAIAIAKATVGDNEHCCENCGKTFYSRFSRVKYCSKECNSAKWLSEQEYRKTLSCHLCNKTFAGTYAQALRAKRGLPVFCSILCRQSHNGASKATKHCSE